ncbi:MAG: hypothetical protein WBL39_04895, partial [Terrimicrobiaceae bacterium]
PFRQIHLLSGEPFLFSSGSPAHPEAEVNRSFPQLPRRRFTITSTRAALTTRRLANAHQILA